MGLSSRVTAAFIVVAAGTGLFSAGPAIAASTKAPPGLSGAVQYTETIPGPGGNKPVRDIKGDKAKRHGSPAQTLGAKPAAKLEALGPEGRAAADLAAAGAVDKSPKNGRNHHRSTAAGSKGGTGPGAGGVKTGGGSEASGSSSIGQIADQVFGSSGPTGMGLLQPILIVFCAIAALTFIVGRRRSSSNHD